MPVTVIDIATLVGVFSLLVAIIGVIIELHNSRLSLQTQTLLDLETRFYSQEMKALRQAAARKILAENPVNCELEDVLDFLHNVVTLIDRGVIDKKLALEFYKYWIARYWISAKPYIISVRELDVRRVFATVNRSNMASIRVLEKIGMQCVQSTKTDLVYEIRRSQQDLGDQ